jgi:hypothetical protein
MNKKNIKVLLDEGFSIKTIRSLSENQRNILAKKILNEAQTSVVKKTTYTKGEVEAMTNKGTGLAVNNGEVVPGQDGSLTVVSGEGEMKENQDDLTALTRQDYTGQQGPHDADDMAPDGMDDDSDNNRSMMNELSDEEIDLMLDIIKSKKSNGEKVKEDNLKSLEESVMKIVKKHIPASITKGDLVKLVNEAPLTKPAPVKEPGIAPSKPERKTPFQPKHKPKPKAGKELPDWMSYSEIFDSEPFTKPAPVKPDVAPSKPERKTPFQPKHKPKPKAEK